VHATNSCRRQGPPGLGRVRADLQQPPEHGGALPLQQTTDQAHGALQLLEVTVAQRGQLHVFQAGGEAHPDVRVVGEPRAVLELHLPTQPLVKVGAEGLPVELPASRVRNAVAYEHEQVIWARSEA